MKSRQSSDPGKLFSNGSALFSRPALPKRAGADRLRSPSSACAGPLSQCEGSMRVVDFGGTIDAHGPRPDRGMTFGPQFAIPRETLERLHGHEKIAADGLDQIGRA